MIVLPRQARDKHWERALKTKTRFFVGAAEDLEGEGYDAAIWPLPPGLLGFVLPLALGAANVQLDPRNAVHAGLGDGWRHREHLVPKTHQTNISLSLSLSRCFS